jgi:hypothetical protein
MNTPQHTTSPMQALRALLARMRAAFGDLLEYRVLSAIAERETAAVSSVHGEAVGLSEEVDRLRTAIRSAAVDGRVTNSDLQGICRRCAVLGRHAHAHTAHLAAIL